MAMLLAFAPFIVFAMVDWLAGVTIGLMAGSAVPAAMMVRDLLRPGRGPKPLEIGTAILFSALALYTLLSGPAQSIFGIRLALGAGLCCHASRRHDPGLRAHCRAKVWYRRNDPGLARSAQVHQLLSAAAAGEGTCRALSSNRWHKPERQLLAAEPKRPLPIRPERGNRMTKTSSLNLDDAPSL